MRSLASILALCIALAVAGCGGDDSTTESTEATQTTATESSEAAESTTSPAKKSKPAAKKTKPKVSVPGGPPPKKLEIEDLEEGTGAAAEAGNTVTVQYVGVGYQSGKEFDTSWGRPKPFIFQLGVGKVIPGWDQGIEGMKVGGRRELVIPPELAYGETGIPPSIGPNETLIFVVDLLAVE